MQEKPFSETHELHEPQYVRDMRKELNQYRALRFPEMVRKMWSGGEVAAWLGEQHARIREGH